MVIQTHKIYEALEIILDYATKAKDGLKNDRITGTLRAINNLTIIERMVSLEIEKLKEDKQ